MNYSGIKYFDVANGPGIRTTLFVSGCTHHCQGCFNMETWDFHNGEEYTDAIEDKIVESLSSPYVTGLTLLGGEPLELIHQPYMLKLVKRVKEAYPNKSIWCFTGYLFEDFFDNGKQRLKITDELFSYLDVLVDGEFILSQKDLALKFKGSRNQRTIDVVKSLQEKKVILYQF